MASTPSGRRQSSAARELRTGCRRGNPSALDALLYQCADGIYAMALSAVQDEHEAEQVVGEVWRKLLRALKAPRFDADPARRVWRITERVLTDRVGREAAARARRSVTADDGAVGLEGLGLRRDVLEELSELSHERAPDIRSRWKVRRNVFRGSLIALFLVALAVWAAVFYQRSRASQDLARLQYQCLRQRVIRQQMPLVMREVSFQIDDPTGADRQTAADCERVLLVLEEIANSDSLAQLNNLRYMRQRIARHNLADFVRSLESTFPERSRELPRVALALEEVQNL
jgi:DNA-directed RNA polymerase specialized sigma24 family protein